MEELEYKNDENRVKIKNTKYYVGKLYICNEIYTPNLKELNIDVKDDNLLYNPQKGMGDCHFLPQDCKVAEDCAKQIVCLKNRIMNVKQDNVKLWASRGIRILGKYKYDNQKHNLFHYIRHKTENCTYEIMFIRFYKSEEELKINCILNSLQFCAYTGAVQSIDLYPASSKNGEVKKNENGIYYNPWSSFRTCPEDIIKEFIEFIKKSKKCLGIND